MTSPSLSWRGKLASAVLSVSGIQLSIFSVYLTRPFGFEFIVGVLVLTLLLFGTVGGLLYYPYRDIVGTNVQSADEPIQGEYTGLCAAYETSVRGVWTADQLQDTYGFADIDGVIPRNRYLFLDTTFFNLYSSAEQRAVVARECKLADNYYLVFAKTLVYLALESYVITVIVGKTFGLSIVINRPLVPEIVFVFVLLVGIRLTRRKVYEADEFAAKQTSVETVITTLEKFDQESQEDDDRWALIYLLSLLWTRPSPEKRIEHLQKQIDENS
jgi:Zn-dependent protease with chaperone function